MVADNILVCTNPKPSDNYFARVFYGHQKNVFEPLEIKWYDDVKEENYVKAD